jgi:thiamine-monophosphate kinase
LSGTVVPLGEFDLIARYFSRPGTRQDVLLGVGDDAALLSVPPGRALVAATDTLVEGRHFLPDAPPDSVGHQALAVNLSDLAAMGAEPAWALLSLSLPAADPAWLEPFAAGLYALAGQHDVTLVGGDTVRGPRVITVTALGVVEPALALRRDRARPGDLLYVSGWPGEAAAGLESLQKGTGPPDDPLVRRYRYAEPRVALGRALRGRATAAMDVSDGLLGDLGKLCASSGVSAVLDLGRLPVSGPLARAHSPVECERLVLCGGDDYELLFTLPAAAVAVVESMASTGLPLHCIGRIEAGHGVQCRHDGRPATVAAGGYDHFA